MEGSLAAVAMEVAGTVTVADRAMVGVAAGMMVAEEDWAEGPEGAALGEDTLEVVRVGLAVGAVETAVVMAVGEEDADTGC